MAARKPWKRLLLLFIFIFIFFIVIGLNSLSRLEASSGISVRVNDSYLSFDQPPLLVNGTTLIPFRPILEALGAQVHWEQATGKVIASRGATQIVLNTRENIASVNGEKVLLDVSARVVNGRTLVPVRFIAESLGAQVHWDQERELVQVTLVRVEGIALNKSELELEPGETAMLTATVLPENAANKKVTWLSNNPSVAAVHRASSTEAVVTPRREGTAVIFAMTEEEGYVAACRVSVAAREVPVTGISLNRSSLSLVAGQHPITIAATVRPADASNKKVSWSSSNASVATVGSSSLTEGIVTPLAPGRAVITARTEDGGFIATCNVTVEAYSTPVRGITLEDDSLSLQSQGNPRTLTAYIYPRNASNQAVSWQSSNTRVVTVDRYAEDPSNGMVQARLVPREAGTAIVTVKTEDGEFVATCIVTVY